MWRSSNFWALRLPSFLLLAPWQKVGPFLIGLEAVIRFCCNFINMLVQTHFYNRSSANWPPVGISWSTVGWWKQFRRGLCGGLPRPGEFAECSTCRLHRSWTEVEHNWSWIVSNSLGMCNFKHGLIWFNLRCCKMFKVVQPHGCTFFVKADKWSRRACIRTGQTSINFEVSMLNFP